MPDVAIKNTVGESGTRSLPQACLSVPNLHTNTWLICQTVNELTTQPCILPVKAYTYIKAVSVV